MVAEQHLSAKSFIIDASPKQVAAALGVSESSVKRWCDRGHLATSRTPGGHRRVAVADVLRFARDRGHVLRAPSALFVDEEPSRSPSPTAAAARRTLMHALLADDAERVAATILDAWRARGSVHALSDEVITPVFAEIGERWERGTVDVYEERRACELVHRALREIDRALPVPGRGAPRAIGGTLEGDPFSLPTALAELVLRERGYDASSLGTWLPAETIAHAVSARRPRLVWLSVGHVVDARRLAAGHARVEEAARTVGASLVVGGRALEPAVRKQLRYAAFCDAMGHLASFADALHA